MIFKKKNGSEKEQKNTKIKKLRSELLLKHGSYNAALIAIVLVAVVVVNIIATALVARFPLEVDLTSTGENTVSEENVDYIKNVDNEVSIVVCATEDGYTGGYLSSFAYSTYMAQDSTGLYYSQTVKLLKLYEKYNSKIKLSFQDPDAASFSTVQEIVPDTTLKYGDILIYSNVKGEDGNTVTNARVVGYKDIYELTDSTGYAAYGYGTYTVSGSNVETAVTSAIYSVTSEDAKKIALIMGHGTTGAFDTFASNLKLNNYETVEVTEGILTAIPEEADVVAIVAPQTDFAASEIEILEKFLENGGKRGKNMMIFLNSKNNSLPNLYAFLAEWGAEVESEKMLYETNSSNYLSGDPTAMGFQNTKSDFTTSVNAESKIYISTGNVAMKAAYETYGKRTATVLMSSYDTVVAAPISVEVGKWTPDSSYKGAEYAAAIYTSDTIYDDDQNEYTSGMLIFSSSDFISSSWQAYDSVGNTAFALSALNSVSGKDDTGISFVQKTVTSLTFTQPSEASVTAFRVLFVILLPVAFIAVGVVVWYRRKNR